MEPPPPSRPSSKPTSAPKNRERMSKTKSAKTVPHSQIYGYQDKIFWIKNRGLNRIIDCSPVTIETNTDYDVKKRLRKKGCYGEHQVEAVVLVAFGFPFLVKIGLDVKHIQDSSDGEVSKLVYCFFAMIQRRQRWHYDSSSLCNLKHAF